jgi:hypothetical protein
VKDDNLQGGNYSIGANGDRAHSVRNICLIEAQIAEKRIAASLTNAIILGPRIVGRWSLQVKPHRRIGLLALYKSQADCLDISDKLDVGDLVFLGKKKERIIRMPP